MRDDVILHEYGHLYEDKLGKLPWIPSRHDGCRAEIADPDGTVKTIVNSREHAWMEAFATAFAIGVTGAPPGRCPLRLRRRRDGEPRPVLRAAVHCEGR